MPAIAAAAWADQARGEDIAQAEDLSGALMDQEMDAMLCDGDVGLGPCAQGRVLMHPGKDERVFEPGDDFGELIARDLAHPRDKVEREQDAQEEQEQLGHEGQ